MGGWLSAYALLQDEFIQRTLEGCRIPATLRRRFAELHPIQDAWNDLRVNPIYDDLMALPDDPELARREPNDLSEIRALRPAGVRDLKWRPAADELMDRLWGAWTARCVGCALGKPVEVGWMPRPTIKKYLQNRGEWPLRDYFSGRDVGDGLRIESDLSQRENTAFMQGDDDITYSLVGLNVLEKHGPDFSWADVAESWMRHIPFWFICGAEAMAFLNLLNHSCRQERGSATPAFTRRYRNPYREYIGAQIRSDGWAWACAGKPELAAEFAYRDACWTHERNGIYGEMFMAAIQAAAFVEHDPARLVDIGLSEIPRECRLAQSVRQCLAWIKQCPDFEACMDKVDEVWAGNQTTIPNALACVLSLFYGEMDTVVSPAIVVMCGLDPDSNGATVGSIVGAASGRKRMKPDLADRLHDTIRNDMMAWPEVTMKELAARTAVVWHKVDEYARDRSGR